MLMHCLLILPNRNNNKHRIGLYPFYVYHFKVYNLYNFWKHFSVFYCVFTVQLIADEGVEWICLSLKRYTMLSVCDCIYVSIL